MCGMSFASHTDAKLTSFRLRVVSLLSWRFLTKPDCILIFFKLVKLSRENDNRAVSEGKSYPIITDLDFLPADYPIFIIITREVQLTLVPIDSFPNHGRKWSSKGVPEHYKLSRFVIRNKTSIWVLKTTTVLSCVHTQAGCFSRQTIHLRICQIPCLSDEGVDCTLRFHQSRIGFSTAPPFSRWRSHHILS